MPTGATTTPEARVERGSVAQKWEHARNAAKRAARQEAPNAGRLRVGHGHLPFRLPTVYSWSALLFTLVAVLPLAWGVQPVPYQLGSVARMDVVSRVDFLWRDTEEEERLVREIERTFSNHYRQVWQGTWVSDASSGLWELLEASAKAESAEQLIQRGKENGFALEEKQAQTLIGAMQNPNDRVEVFWDVVSPMQAVLREHVFKRGLMDPERFNLERGKTIRIIDPEREDRTTRVLRNDPLSPIEPSQLPGVLNEGFSRMSSLGYDFRALLRDLLIPRLKPTLVHDEAASQAALQELKERARSETQRVEADRTILLARGEVVTPARLEKLRHEDRRYREEQGRLGLAREVLSKMLLILIVAFGFLFFLGRYGMAQRLSGRRVLTVALLAEILVLIAYGLIHMGLPATLLPIGILAGATAWLLGIPVAMLSVTSVCLMMLVLFEGQIGAVMGCLAAGWLFANLVPPTRYALGLVSGACLSGVLAGTIVIASGLAANEALHVDVMLAHPLSILTGGYVLGRGLAVLIVWFLTGVATMALLPLLETTYALTTRTRLQSLQDQNHPLLRRLVLEAPGTHHHSVIVGILAEAGAEAIGADTLLTKVGSHYHDIGKIMKPEYFTENETGISRHDGLKPSMSALIIMAHVKDGAEMGRAIHLPPGIVEIIEQHHGTGLIKFFHHLASETAAPGETVAEQPFRYPGPRPKSREAALVMLADSVEAASRSLSDPSPAHIGRLITDLLMGRLLDGQLDDTGLTLTDLKVIEQAFFRVLTSMFHTRVKYPGQVEEEERRLRRR